MSIQRLQVSNVNTVTPCLFVITIYSFCTVIKTNNGLLPAPFTIIFIKINNFSDATLIGASITYVAGLFLLLSFAGPYWIESYPEMFSSFKHMGLWEYCFDRFRFPSYQFDKLFHGCHYIFSEVRSWFLLSNYYW